MSPAALIVCASPAPASAKLVRELAAAADFRIGVDAGAESLLAAGVEVDAVVGDFDSLSADGLTGLQASGTHVVRHPAHKDHTDLALALAFARDNGYSDVVVTGAAGGRVDHHLAVIGELCRAADLRPVQAEDAYTAIVLHPQGRPTVDIDGAGTTFSVIAPLGPATVSVEGAVWPLDHASLGPLSDLGVSNRVRGAGSRVCVHDGTVLVITPAELGK